MAHDATKLVMGGTVSSIKDVRSAKGVVAAGLVTHKKADGTIEGIQSTGVLCGISLGKDLSNAGFSSYVERGNGVPALLTAAFSPTQGNGVWYDPTTGKLAASGSAMTALSAVYASAIKTGILEDGTTGPAALIDFNSSL